MSDVVRTVLILFCLLQIKHMFADYFLQTRRMLAGRGEYLHLGRAQHCGVHAIGSALAFLLVGTGLPLIAVIVVIEWVVHFHIDWGKALYYDAQGLDPSKAAFWRAAGFDQALHHLSYIAMVWCWVVFTVP